LFHRARTGEGQDLWTSLFNGAAMLSSDVLRRADGEVLRRPGLDRGLHGTSPCDRLYVTQDGWVQVAAMTGEHWKSLCTVLGLTDLAEDPGAAGYENRVTRRREIEPILEAAFLTATAAIWVGLLDAAGVPSEVVVDTISGELSMYDADNERLGLVTDVEHPLLGRIRQFGSLVHFSASPEPTFGPPPMRGEHTRSVLERHGFDTADIDDLLARGIIADASGDYPWPV